MKDYFIKKFLSELFLLDFLLENFLVVLFSI